MLSRTIVALFVTLLTSASTFASVLMHIVLLIHIITMFRIQLFLKNRAFG